MKCGDEDSRELVSLIDRMVQGQSEALAHLFAHTSPVLRALMTRRLDGPDAEEALLDVYMKVWRNASRYSSQRGTVYSWLVVIARNVVLDRLRQQKSRKDALVIGSVNDVFLRSALPSPEDLAISSERRHDLEHLMLKLSVDQRQVLEMAFFGDSSHSEVSRKLGQPLGTVKTRIRVGLARLRILIDEREAVAPL